jgi:tRNA threonylcarbamoyl adenosine modification protein YeaZ
VLVLAVDTSSAAVTAALVEVTGTDVLPVVQRVVLNARGHGELLAPEIAACLAEAGRTPADLAAVVAGTGPGPYTGLRVGLVTAAVMGETLGVPTYGVCSLDAIGSPELTGVVATDARRREVYWARYEDGVRTDGPHVDRPDSLVLQGETAGAGARQHGLGVPLDGRDHPSGLELVRVAADRIRSAAPSEVLVPLYLRHPDAVPPGAAKPVSA